MTNEGIAPHPGQILLRDFLTPRGLDARTFATVSGISPDRIDALIAGERGVEWQTAWLLASALGTSPELWLNLQAAHDLAPDSLSR